LAALLLAQTAQIFRGHSKDVLKMSLCL